MLQPTLFTFSLSERNRRWQLVRQRMVSEGIFALVTPPNTGMGGKLQANARYLTSIGGNYTAIATVFPQKAEVTAIVTKEPGAEFWRLSQDWVSDIILGRLSIINNAGIYPDKGVNILTVSRELLNQTMNVNAFGAVQVTQAFLPLLSKSDAARIVNTSTGYGQLAGLSADVPSYCLSKLTLNGVTIMLAEALQSQGIVVNAIDPGWVQSDMGGATAPRTLEQGADTAVWLATEAPAHLTGKLFHDRREVSY
jgi:NAD(P)-dependent dehydrogenase (short-subunit alcohol dehydrogenase family)